MKDKIVFGAKIVLLVLIVAWVGVVVVDYFNARNSKNPNFCIKEQVKIYSASGTLERTIGMDEFNNMSDSEKEATYYTYACTGLGYKVYRYHRDFSAIEFGPFFISERQSIND